MNKTPYQMYYDWWVGKWCRNASQQNEEFELVVDVELIGPPSFVYGSVVLIMGDGTRRNVIIDAPSRYNAANIFRPRKKDVIALTIEEYHAMKKDQNSPYRR